MDQAFEQHPGFIGVALFYSISSFSTQPYAKNLFSGSHLIQLKIFFNYFFKSGKSWKKYGVKTSVAQRKGKVINY